jgi:hypothetical protein
MCGIKFSSPFIVIFPSFLQTVLQHIEENEQSKQMPDEKTI